MVEFGIFKNGFQNIMPILMKGNKVGIEDVLLA